MYSRHGGTRDCRSVGQHLGRFVVPVSQDWLGATVWGYSSRIEWQVPCTHWAMRTPGSRARATCGQVTHCALLASVVTVSAPPLRLLVVVRQQVGGAFTTHACWGAWDSRYIPAAVLRCEEKDTHDMQNKSSNIHNTNNTQRTLHRGRL